jgi:DNA polymerase-1
MYMEPLFLLDAYGSIYRSYFAFIGKPLRNPRGENVSAAFGFFRSLFQLWEQYHPKYFAAVFDSPAATFRHEMYPEYKANRQKTPEDLHAQIPLVMELLGLLQVPSISVERYEADDIIATLAERCRSEGRHCYIVSSDKDLLQLVGGPVQVLKPDRDIGFRLTGSSEVQTEWGVPAAKILDLLSLTGDSSDNVPGVPGVGAKTAVKLLAEYGSFDAIWEALPAIKPDGIRRKLEAGKDSAMLSRRLITLVSDMPLPFTTLESLRIEQLAREAAADIFLREGMRSLAGKSSQAKDPGGLDRPERSSQAGLIEHGGLDGMGGPGSLDGLAGPDNLGYRPGSSGLDSTRTSALSKPSTSQMGGGLFDVQTLPDGFSDTGSHELILDIAALKRWITAASQAACFAFDCETDSLDELHTLPVGFSIAISTDAAAYVPLAAPDGQCLPADQVRTLLAPLLARPDTMIVGHNLKFDMHVMENWGTPIACRPWDTMVAAWLLEPERDSLKLEALGQSWLQYNGTPYADVVPKGSVFSAVPLSTAAPYAAEDAYMVLRLKARFEQALLDRGLLALFNTVEMPVLALLARMERTGIMVDAAALRTYGRELELELASIQNDTFSLVGHAFNMNSPKQLQEILFVERKLGTGKKTRTGYSTDISVLEELAREDPVPALILRHRTLQKLKSSYVDALVELADRDPRIHTHFVQTGTATGRLSSREPNLQNIPIREDAGRRIRASFVAAPGMTLISADYAQIELVILAHLSEDPELIKAFRDGADVHRRTAALIMAKPEQDVSQSERRAAKTINFGVIYGMGAYRLAQELGIPRVEAQQFIDAYFSRYAGVAAYIRQTIETAQRLGRVTTVLGRQRPLPSILSRNANERQGAERIAVNTPVQGSAADIMKLAMLSVDRLLHEQYPEARLLLQVHDELIVEAPEAQAAALAIALGQTMASAYDLRVPLKVGVEIARNWGGMH